MRSYVGGGLSLEGLLRRMTFAASEARWAAEQRLRVSRLTDQDVFGAFSGHFQVFRAVFGA